MSYALATVLTGDVNTYPKNRHCYGQSHGWAATLLTPPLHRSESASPLPFARKSDAHHPVRRACHQASSEFGGRVERAEFAFQPARWWRRGGCRMLL